jgi:hypothetical protein
MKKISTLFILCIGVIYGCIAQESLNKLNGKDSVGSKVDSLNGVIQALSSQNKELVSENKKLSSDNDDVNESIKALQRKLSLLDKNLPSNISFDKFFCTDDEVFVSFRLNKEGRIKTAVYRKSDHTLEKSIISSYGLSPNFHFSNLRPGEIYTFEAIVIDNNGVETMKKLDATLDNRMEFTTALRRDPPNLGTDRVQSTAGEITIPIKISNHQNVACKYVCTKRNTLNNTSVVEDIEVAKKDIELNEFGLPLKTEPNPEIKISNLQPSTTYTITLTVANDFGKNQQIVLSVATTNPIPELQFTGGISIDFNPLQTTISWKPNIEAHAGKVRIISRDQKSLFETNADKVKDSLIAIIPYDDISKIIEWKNKNTKEVPYISVTMDDGKGNTKEALVSITLSVPTKEQITTNKTLSSDQKNQLLDASKKVLDASGNPKKDIKWQDLVSLGVPILLHFL